MMSTALRRARRAAEIHEAGHVIAGLADGGVLDFVIVRPAKEGAVGAVQWRTLPGDQRRLIVAGYAADITLGGITKIAVARKQAMFDFEDWQGLVGTGWQGFEAEAQALAREFSGPLKSDLERFAIAFRNRNLIGPRELAALAAQKPVRRADRWCDWWSLKGHALEPAMWASALGLSLWGGCHAQPIQFFTPVLICAALGRISRLSRCNNGGET